MVLGGRKRKGAGRTSPAIGDVIEIRTSQGLAYAQFTHRHSLMGELIRVLPGVYESRPLDLSSLVASRERFYTFFPLQAALRRKLVTAVRNEAVPESARPFPLMRLRVPGAREGIEWRLWDGMREWKVETLTEEHRQLSLASIINDTLLIEWIESGWTPGDVV